MAEIPYVCVMYQKPPAFQSKKCNGLVNCVTAPDAYACGGGGCVVCVSMSGRGECRRNLTRPWRRAPGIVLAPLGNREIAVGGESIAMHPAAPRRATCSSSAVDASPTAAAMAPSRRSTSTASKSHASASETPFRHREIHFCLILKREFDKLPAN